MSHKPDPIKVAARIAVAKALHSGELVKPSKCSNCGQRKRLDGHHPDYAKQLEVVWLCRRCHKRAHFPSSAEVISRRRHRHRAPRHPDHQRISITKYVQCRLSQECAQFGSRSALAVKLGFASGHICAVINHGTNFGRRVGEEFLDALAIHWDMSIDDILREAVAAYPQQEAA